MKGVMPLAVSLVLLTSANALGQSDRIGGRINDRIGGRVNGGGAVQPRGLYGPDPYVGPGSVSPFSQSPVVPLRSAPVAEPNPYTSRYPSTVTPQSSESPMNQPTVLGPADLLPRAGTEEQRARQPSPVQSPEREKRVGQKLDEGLQPSAQIGSPQKPSEESAHRPLTAKKVKDAPCANGRMRTANGDCAGPLRPK
jgi:hypothetical protein